MDLLKKHDFSNFSCSRINWILDLLDQSYINPSSSVKLIQDLILNCITFHLDLLLVSSILNYRMLIADMALYQMIHSQILMLNALTLPFMSFPHQLNKLPIQNIQQFFILIYCSNIKPFAEWKIELSYQFEAVRLVILLYHMTQLFIYRNDKDQKLLMSCCKNWILQCRC